MQKAINGFLPNGTLINNVANFYTSTKPTTRVDGSALVIGDVWVNPSTQTQWFWNGTYWLSAPLLTVNSQLVLSTSGLSTNICTDVSEYNIFVKKIHWTGKTGSGNNASNYRGITLYGYTNNGLNSTLVGNVTDTSAMTASTYFSVTFNWNYLISTVAPVTNSATPTVQAYYIQSAVLLGAPGAAYESLQVQYCLAVK